MQFLRLLAMWWPREYDRMIRERWRCGLVSDYFRHLLLLVCSVFLPRDAKRPRYCPSVCASHVGVPLKRLNESSWFLACELPSTRPTLC